jgi:NAD-dependent dihydropyrimidine dehydrogenase PreA subunit
VKRKIVKIDEAKCDGCGLCISNCREGAIKIIDGKARLIGDALCDGLGACLGHCPQGAITMEDRDAVVFDEAAVRAHLVQPKDSCGCPGAKMMDFRQKKTEVPTVICSHQESQLRQWPVQLRLVPAQAPYLNGSDLLICADCVPFACADFHRKYLQGKVLLVACPKLDDPQVYKEKLNQIIAQNDFKSIVYARMEVACCAGLVNVIKQTLIDHGKTAIPFREEIISIQE